MPDIKEILEKYMGAFVYGFCGVAALLVYGCWYINGRDSDVQPDTFFFRAGLMMTVVFGLLCCGNYILHSNKPKTEVHVSVLFVCLTYIMGLFLLISSIPVILKYSKDKHDFIEHEIYDFPGLYFILGIVGAIISVVAIAYGGYITYLLIEDFRDL